MNAHSGPLFCELCGAWPAMETSGGLRCAWCDDREWAQNHPVPLPDNPSMLADLASIGVPGAAEKLAKTIL